MLLTTDRGILVNRYSLDIDRVIRFRYDIVVLTTCTELVGELSPSVAGVWGRGRLRRRLRGRGHSHSMDPGGIRPALQ